jgi:hypothetical protein
VLKPGGLLLTYSGQAFLPDILNRVGEHLEYLWTCAIRHTGGELRFRKLNLHNQWKPLPLFCKPKLDCWWEPFRDMFSGGKEKDAHDWQQAESEAAHFIKALCPKGGLVCDPFAGSGTSLAAAKKLGTRIVGFEIDAGVAAEARKRIK